MAKIILQNETSTPSTPSTTKSVLYIEANQLKSVGDDGIVRVYSVGITPEEVQDIVADLVKSGTGISVVYDDPNNTLTINSTITQYTNEQAQDAIAAALLNSSSIQFTYNDTNNTITAVVLPAGVDHNSLLNYSANKHIDHTGVSITAGTGLTGGGDLTATRTLSLADTTVTAGTYGNSTMTPVMTVNSKGQLTALSVSSVSIITSQISDFVQAANEIFVDKAGDDLTGNGTEHKPFATIAKALTEVLYPSNINPYKIRIGTGVFTEPHLVLPNYTSLMGASINSTIIEPAAATHHCISMSLLTEVTFLTIRNVGTGYAALNVQDVGNFAQCHKVSFYSCDIGILVKTVLDTSIMYAEYVDFNDVYSHAFYVKSTNAEVCECNCENVYTFPTEVNGEQFYVEGPGAKIDTGFGHINGVTTDTMFYVKNGASLYISGIHVADSAIGLHAPNIGAASDITASALDFDCVTNDLLIEHPGTTGNFDGTADQFKVSIAIGCPFSAAYSDHKGSQTGLNVLQDLYQGSRQDKLVNISKILRDTCSLGVTSGGVITRTTGLGISVSAGTGILIDSDGYIKEVSWPTTALTMPASESNYILALENNTVVISASLGDGYTTISLGNIYARSSSIHYLEQTPMNALHFSNAVSLFQRDAFGVIYSSGSIATESGTRNLNVSDGVRWFASKKFISVGGNPWIFEEHYRDGSGGFVHGPTNKTTVRNDVYDDGSGTLANLSTGYYTKHTIYVTGEGAYQENLFVFGQAQYATLVEAEGADLPTPPTEFKESTAPIAAIIVQQGNASIVEISDIRPIIGFKASGVSATAYHSNLLGLLNDDHTQYLLGSGARALSGNLNMGTHNITSVGTVDGVTVSAHASRHLPNGADSLPTAAPSVDLSTTSTNAVGIANSLARSDHSHAITFPTPAQISGFDEAAQDAVGGILTDTTSIDFTYNDAGTQISAVVLPAGVDHNSLSNYVANKHIDHSGVSISAGNGLSGGGDITATRTISMPNVGTAGTYGSATNVPVFTTDAQGRISGTTNTAIAIAESQVTNLTTDLGNKVNTSTTITAGTGLSGGGDLSTNRTISLANTTVTAASYGSATQVAAHTVDAQGRLTAASNVAIQIAESQVTNLTTDLSAKALGATTITAGTGLSGGGDLSTNRTISLANTAVTAGSYGSTSNSATITVDAQGRLTSASNTAIDHNQLTNVNSTNAHSLVTTAAPGFMSAADKTKLDGITNETFYSTTAAISTSNNNTFTNITELGFAVTSGSIYKFDITMKYHSANTNTSIVFAFTTTGGATGNVAADSRIPNANTTSVAFAISTLNQATTGATTSGAANTDYIARLQGIFECTGTGNFYPQFRSSRSGTLVTVVTGSINEVRSY